MSPPDPIARITLIHAPVTAKTVWSFVAVETRGGIEGYGEATLNNQTAALTSVFERSAPSLIGAAAEPAPARAGGLPADLASAAIISALDQARWDIRARREGKSIAALLGQKRDRVGLYANINRRIEPRTPAAFADSAQLAITRGFNVVKIAPFDEVTPQTASLERCAPGLARIAATRAALPAGAALYVDCHWRFTTAVAIEIVPLLAERGVAWYECPIAEADETIADLKQLRALSNARDMVLAGRETGIGAAAFEPFARAGAYDVMMPDIKYIGGIDEMRRTADMLARHGIATSPHNPTGPVCHAASMAVCASLADVGLLELQLDETPLFDTLVTPAPPGPVGGYVTLPTGSGLGLALDRPMLQRLHCRETIIE